MGTGASLSPFDNSAVAAVPSAFRALPARAVWLPVAGDARIWKRPAGVLLSPRRDVRYANRTTLSRQLGGMISAVCPPILVGTKPAKGGLFGDPLSAT